MNGNANNNYGYYYPPPPPPNAYQEQSQQWNNWSLNQQQYAHNYPKNPQSYYGSSINSHAPPNLPPPVRAPPQFLTPPKFRIKRFNRQGNNFLNQQQNRLKSPSFNLNKRPRIESPEVQEPKTKSSRKKKKPLSQNVPSIRSWTPEDAIRALAVEKEHNKHSNDHSLIIRFPDLPLNKDIVSKFHPAIDNVHFQQPSTARYCYVTLEENVDVESVISALNKQKFGDGFLSAEYKRDREEEQNIGPEDIDPLTLYVGNLAQDIIKEDLASIYPKAKRIDIGFAKKMKFTRYAFVSYKTVDDCIEAFRKTHSTELYARSLIVRFRRLHGTVGMPGEAKPQNSGKRQSESESTSTSNGEIYEESLIDSDKATTSIDTESTTSYSEDTETTTSELTNDDIDLNKIKEEPNYSDYEDNADSLDIKPDVPIKTEYKSRLSAGDAAALFAQHKPFVELKLKTEQNTREEGEEEINGINLPDNTTTTKDDQTTSQTINSNTNCSSDNSVTVKSEPDDYNIDGIEFYEHDENSDFESEDDESAPPDFAQIYNTMINHKNKLNQLKKLTSN